MSVLRRDPTRTTTLRKRFQIDMRKRFVALRRAVVKFIGTDDEFDLAPRREVTFNAQFEFLSNPEKLSAFQQWMQEQVDAGILEVADGSVAPWTNEYVESAYKKGTTRAYIDSKGIAAVYPEQAIFLAESFTAPVAVDQIKLIATRAFEELKGVTQAMGQQMNRIFADAIAHGTGPRAVALELSRTIDGITKKRALTLARTEIIRSYAEGQLDAFKKLGIQELGVEVEFASAGDDRVCPICLDLDGNIFTEKTARGVIPVHPNCRCAWIPRIPESKTTKN